MPKVIDDADVFRAVLALVQKKGYTNATTKRLAAAAGIHETTLFDKYGSKAELILAALSYHMSLSPMKDLIYSGDVRFDLIAIMRAYQSAIGLVGDYINVLIYEIPSQSQLNSVMALLLADIQPVALILQKYQEQGVLKQENALVLVSELIAPFFMNHTFSRAFRGISLPDVDLERRVDGFLYGYGTGKGEVTAPDAS